MDWADKLAAFRNTAGGLNISVGNCKSEYGAVVKEIERRSLFWDLAGIALNSVVSGTVGKVSINANDNFSQEKFKKIIVRLNQSQASLPSSMFQDLVSFKQFCSDLITVRVAISEKNWELSNALCDEKFHLVDDNYAGCPHSDIIKFFAATSTKLVDEIKLCSIECNFQFALAKLKESLQRIEVS